jgi:hypothetical protein
MRDGDPKHCHEQDCILSARVPFLTLAEFRAVRTLTLDSPLSVETGQLSSKGCAPARFYAHCANSIEIVQRSYSPVRRWAVKVGS